ncbi:hypothetical protein BH10ACT7_BH10ACT7_07920 [soil metagenome]
MKSLTFRLAALSFAFGVLASLSGCVGETPLDEPDIVGVWVHEGESVESLIEFRADGTFSATSVPQNALEYRWIEGAPTTNLDMDGKWSISIGDRPFGVDYVRLIPDQTASLPPELLGTTIQANVERDGSGFRIYLPQPGEHGRSCFLFLAASAEPSRTDFQDCWLRE